MHVGLLCCAGLVPVIVLPQHQDDLLDAMGTTSAAIASLQIRSAARDAACARLHRSPVGRATRPPIRGRRRQTLRPGRFSTRLTQKNALGNRLPPQRLDPDIVDQLAADQGIKEKLNGSDTVATLRWNTTTYAEAGGHAGCACQPRSVGARQVLCRGNNAVHGFGHWLFCQTPETAR